MKIHTIIVNYRTPDSTVRAIEAAVAGLAGVDDWQISVVDNESGDNSLEVIQKAVAGFDFRDRVSVIASEHNGGFGYGNNLVLREAIASDNATDNAADYYYLCNPDSYPDAGSTTALAKYMDEHPNCGIAGGQLYDDTGEDCPSAFRFHNLLAEMDQSLQLGIVSLALMRCRVALPPPCNTGAVNWVSGASFMIRREVLEKVGLFDEAFFLYYEETDYCRRAKNAGWATHHVADARVHHIGGLSLNLDEPTARLPDWWFESRRYYFLKHHGRLYTMATNVACVVGLSIRKVRHAIQRKTNHAPSNLLGDFVRHNFGSREKSERIAT
jgi:N-acetylglucosaminyl-diphospho-decaprenol L-rhamnosyltransferase